MAADVLAPCRARSSAAMVLAMLDKQVLVFDDEGSKPPVLSQCYESIENTIVFLCFLINP